MIFIHGATVVPLKIQIKNFLSYGPITQSIDFSHHSLICLSGKNGHGKSALLDAITWAVWGHARKAADAIKADAHLLHSGQEQMSVILDFACKDQHYRIRREYHHGKTKQQSILEFGVVKHDSHECVPLTEKSIRLTQQKIEHALRIRYDSFINSAFLRQGNSNEFSKKSPKDRKEILASILGLDHYELLRRKALEKMRLCAGEKSGLIALNEKLARELQSITAVEDELRTVMERLAQAEQDETRFATQRAALTHRRALLEQQHNERKRVSEDIASMQKEYDNKHTRLSELRDEWRSTHYQLLGFSDSYEQIQHARMQVTQQLVHHQTLLQKRVALKETLLTAENNVQTYKRTLQQSYQQRAQELALMLERYTTECMSLNQQRTTLSNRLCSAHTRREKLNDELASARRREKELAEFLALEQFAIAQYERRTTHLELFIAQEKYTISRLQELDNKLSLHELSDNAQCPICEQSLTPEVRRSVTKKLYADRAIAARSAQRLSSAIQRLGPLITTQQIALKRLQEQRTLLTQLTAQCKSYTEMLQEQQAQIAEIENSLHTIISLINETTQKITEYRALIDRTKQEQEQSLNQDTHYQSLLLTHEEAQKELDALSYQEGEHKTAERQLASIDQQLSKLVDMQSQKRLQHRRSAEITMITDTMKRGKLKLRAAQEIYEQFSSLEADLQKLEREVETLNTSNRYTLREKEALLYQKIRLEERGKQLDAQALQSTHYEQHISSLDQDIKDYQRIAAALGKDGIPALIIEEALPEIEDETNAILSRLTNNQSHISIESLRDLKKGGTKETLDIKISDAAGTRPYEFFSGGESFRIDFALRIAISKLLAHRAGTTLQTLIIDEGFGSQDEEGVGNIMETIHAIQKDFCKIIIVSHLESLKEQFPVHFYIEKGHLGSRVTVIEQA